MMNIMEARTFHQIRPTIHQQTTRIITSHLEGRAFKSTQAQTFTNQICNKILKGIVQLNRNFKFIVNCHLIRKTDSAVNLAGACYWDDANDGMLTIKSDFEDYICVVNVFCCAL